MHGRRRVAGVISFRNLPSIYKTKKTQEVRAAAECTKMSLLPVQCSVWFGLVSNLEQILLTYVQYTQITKIYIL